MKTYIFIGSVICGIGGYIQYLYNKINFLESKGWRVLVFSGVDDKILVDGLIKYGKYIYPELFRTPYFHRKSEINKTINSILKDIVEFHDNDCLIESNSFHSAVWAELIASRLNCPHFIYIVQEEHNYDDEMRSFLRFKYNHHQLAGISKVSVSQMLDDELVEKRDDTYFSAFCSNVIKDCNDNYSCLLDSKAIYTLGSFGRITKSCVPAIIDGFCRFAQIHFKEKVNVVFIGGAQDEKEEKRARNEIIRKFSDYNNVNLIITGNIYPVPQSFLKKINVFISTAGAANATYQAGYPTIKVTPDGYPIGIVGLDYTFPEKSFYESKHGLKIEDCIERAIKYYDQIEFIDNAEKDYNIKMYCEFERQLSIVLSSVTGFYYNEDSLMKLKTGYPTHHFEVWLLGHLFGANGTALIKKKWQQLNNIFKK